MNYNIQKYIDLQIIDEYATKHFGEYTLDISEVSKADQENLLDYLFANDEGFREIIQNYMQTLIDERLPSVHASHRRDEGFTPHVDPINGEISWRI